MKTSLNLDDHLFKTAQRDALKQGTTLSEIINRWARMGREVLVKKKVRLPKLKTVDLGEEAKVDLNSREHWMEALDK